MTNGGPAFPLGNTPEEWMNGMSLRDYFAAKGLSILSNPNAYGADPAQVAEYAYAIADAMLKEREKTNV